MAARSAGVDDRQDRLYRLVRRCWSGWQGAKQTATSSTLGLHSWALPVGSAAIAADGIPCSKMEWFIFAEQVKRPGGT
eukprot:84985-Pelagomonas_calceolata.AAC.5